jgi:hypothetical protein
MFGPLQSFQRYFSIKHITTLIQKFTAKAVATAVEAMAKIENKDQQQSDIKGTRYVRAS